MKISIWDILTGLTLLGVLCLLVGFGAILLNPATPLNPFRGAQPDVVPTVALPTPTETSIGLPPTYTPSPAPNQPPAGGQTNALPTLRPSRTPEPTATKVVLPTFTASTTLRVGARGGSGGGSGGGLGGGNCEVIYQNPPDDTVLPAGTTFDMRWTLKNTGSDSWRADSIDVKFVSGDRLHTGADLRDMPYDVSAGSAVDILIGMEAPSTKGTYTTNWALGAGSSSVCRFFVTIKVQ